MIMLRINMALLALLLGGSLTAFCQRTAPSHWFLGGGLALAPTLGGVLGAGLNTRGGYFEGSLSGEVSRTTLFSGYRMWEEYLGVGLGYGRRVASSRSRGVVLSLGGGLLCGLYIPDPFSSLPSSITLDGKREWYFGEYLSSCLEVFLSRDLGVALEGRFSLRSSGELLPARISIGLRKTM